jgi:hypothetical protein
VNVPVMAVMAYPLRLRHIEDMMHEHGVLVDCTTIHNSIPWSLDPLCITNFSRHLLVIAIEPPAAGVMHAAR